jgi:hypothetical protein
MQGNYGRTALRKRAINVNAAFKGVGDLTTHVNRLAINAQVASSHLGEAGEPFAILVRELIKMARDLEEMVENVEIVFSKIVSNVAKWDSVEKKMTMYGKAARLIDKHNGFGEKQDHGENNDGIGNKPEEKTSPPKNESTTHLLEKEIAMSEGKITVHQKGLVENAGKLISQINSVRNLTQRQSVYLAITAKIESVRVSDQGDNLIHVAENISQVTQQIIELQERAESEIELLIKEIDTFERRKNNRAALGVTA